MKAILSTLFLILFSTLGFAQAPSLQWQKSLGGSGTDEARSVYQTSDGGSIIIGASNSTNGDVVGNHGSYDYWLVKLDVAGNVQWKKTYGGSASDRGYAVIQLTYGGYLIVGNASSSDGDVTLNNGASDYWIVRLNSAGTILWQKSYGGSSTDIARGVIQTLDGKLMVIGYSRSSNGNVTNAHGGYDFWLTKLDTSGNLLWQKTYGGTKDDLAYTVKQAADSSYLIVGYTLSNDGDISGGNHSALNDIWVVKADKSGNLLWQKTLGGSSNDYSNSFIQTSDNGYLIIGYTASYDGDVFGNYGQVDLWVIKLDASGNLIWQKTYGGTDNDRANFAAETNDGGYVITGHSESNDIDLSQNQGDKDFWMLKLSSTGILEWKKSIGGSLEDNSYSVAQSSDGGLIAVGLSASSNGDVTFNNGGDDFWIVKISNLSVVAPEKNAIWFSGTTRAIKWKNTGTTNLKLEYSINGGTLYSSIIASVPSSASQYLWNIPNGLNSTQCKIRITDLSNLTNVATNDSLFSILTSPSIISPNGGEVLAANSIAYIYWFSKSTALTFNLEYTLDGINWLPIANGVQAYLNASGNNSGFYAWTVPNVTSTTCKIRITDAVTPALKTASASNFSITQQKSLDLTNPNSSGLSYAVGSTVYISWNSVGISNVNLYFSSDGGNSYSNIVSNYVNTGYYNWTVPNATSTNCYIKIKDASSSLKDSSAANFFIVPASVLLNLNSPNGGEKWYVGSMQSITWTSSLINQIKLEFTSNGSTWTTVANSLPASNGSYFWQVPPSVSSTCKIRISDVSNASILDMSNLDFEIADTTKSLSLTSPNGGEQWQAGTYKPITFTSNNISQFDLFYSTDTGYTWTLISNTVTGSPYFWLVPNAQSTRCLIRISNRGNIIDRSTTFFTITAPFTGTPPSIATFAVPAFCKNAAFNVNFAFVGSFNPGNYFIAQLSDANGSFALPTSIGSVQSSSAGVVSCLVPDYIPNGTGYRIRVVADDPPTIGTNNGANIAINSPEFVFPPASIYYALPTVTAVFSYNGNTNGIASYLWNFGDNTSSGFANTTHTYYQIGVYDVSLTVVSTNGCSITKTNPAYIHVDNTFPNIPLFPNTNSDITGISFVNDSNGCVALKSGECLYTTDKGNIWIPKVNTGLSDASSVSILPGIWMLTSADGKVVKSTDLGASWQVVPQNISAQQSFNDCSLSSTSSGLVVGKNGSVFRYQSGNLNFEISGTTNQLNAVFDGGAWACAVGDMGTILRNNGTGWQVQTSGVSVNLKDVSFATSLIGYACGDNGTVLQTLNGGITWTKSLPAGSEIDFSGIEVSGVDSAWVVGKKGIMYETIDGGATWTRFSKGVSNDNTGLRFKKGSGYITGNGGSLRIFQASAPLGISGIITSSKSFSLFPNPSNGNFNLVFSSALFDRTLLNIFDYEGRIVLSQQLDAGAMEQRITLPAAQLKNGIYFLQLQNSKFDAVKKFVLIR
jgi:photosystem II stability/assembly factor-like uncharacterized protein